MRLHLSHTQNQKVLVTGYGEKEPQVLAYKLELTEKEE